MPDLITIGSEASEYFAAVDQTSDFSSVLLAAINKYIESDSQQPTATIHFENVDYENLAFKVWQEWLKGGASKIQREHLTVKFSGEATRMSGGDDVRSLVNTMRETIKHVSLDSFVLELDKTIAKEAAVALTQALSRYLNEAANKGVKNRKKPLVNVDVIVDNVAYAVSSNGVLNQAIMNQLGAKVDHWEFSPQAVHARKNPAPKRQLGQLPKGPVKKSRQDKRENPSVGEKQGGLGEFAQIALAQLNGVTSFLSQARQTTTQIEQELTQAYRDVDHVVEKSQSSIKQIQASLEEAEQKNKVQEAEIRDLKEENVFLTQRYRELVDSHGDAAHNLGEQKALTEQLKAENSQLQRYLTQSTKGCSSRDDRIAGLQRENAYLQQALQRHLNTQMRCQPLHSQQPWYQQVHAGHDTRPQMVSPQLPPVHTLFGGQQGVVRQQPQSGASSGNPPTVANEGSCAFNFLPQSPFQGPT